MSRLQQPAFIGALVIGICFNVVLGILGLLGVGLVDALYLTLIGFTLVGAGMVQILIQRSRKDES